ncbi:Cof-type HAD-IIB family hydrolase [Alkalibaculum sp. M08DMB]|uniref:Cof-type HAD-IIB family hydrolase n=1 Tax=Alkalibaculum sporogenes TaxID=2655001 RepID=A0A6A7K8I4_9FIRM|nr:Cof-type HAD-IIB family hydrolase [Alkalibaculum sporogenes]MPW25706.1 Cof-type HAD-IIB family hydrolase [Alkalibaculum sporogenes]
MDVRMIAIDMDGTLLYSRHEITNRVKNAVIAAAKKGVKIVLSTGRIYTSARYYTRLMGIETPIITCNGALIKEENRLIYKCPIPQYSLKNALSKLLEYNDVYYQLYSEQTYYAKEESETVRQYRKWNEDQNIDDRVSIKIMNNPMDMIDEPDELLKMFLLQTGVLKERFDQLVSEMNQINGIYCVSSLQNSVDVINRDVNKGNALKYLADQYSINSENIMAIGDNYNDLEMIEYAGLGVAMENAEQPVKDSADYITKSNLEDGVAIAIEKFVL